MDNIENEVERLGLAMSRSARTNPGLIGSALATWEAAHPGQTATTYLKCDERQLWRLAITPQPKGAHLVERAMELATDIGINPTALVNVLRFAKSASTFKNASADSEMLMAALDANEEKGQDS